MSRSSHQLSNEVDRPEPVVSAYELGQTIREMRIALQRDINDVAADLRIKVGYLKAIEDGRFRDLPGPAYATGFVRAYADYLGADSAEVVRLYKEAIGGGDSRTALVLPSPVEEGRLPTGSVLLVAGILAVGAYGGWYYLSLKGQDPLDVVSNVPDRVTKAIRGEQGATSVISASIDLRSARESAAAASSGVTAVATGPSPAGPVDEAPAETAAPPVVAEEAPAPPPERAAASDEAARPAAGETAAAPKEPPPATEPAKTEPAPEATQLAERSAPPPPPPAPDIEPVDMADLPSIGRAPAVSAPRPAEAETPRAETPPPAAQAPEAVAVAGPPIVLRAETASWVEVRDGRDQPVYSGLLRAGETVNLPRLRGLTLNTSNAGGLQITIDGRTMPSLGPRGAVRRNISLDLESLSSALR